ncbi:MAG: hypothetical protein ACI4JN_10805 [Ruminococcus sp.]
MPAPTTKSDSGSSVKTENAKEFNNVLNSALNELIDIQKNDENEPGWIQYMKTDAWEEKYYGKNS